MAELSRIDLRNAVPASLRKPVEAAGLAPGLMARGYNALHGEKNASWSAEAVKLPVMPGSFCRMPDEPEDARLTGVTRSLPRRLLALNLPGSLQGVRTLLPVKVA